MTIRLDAKKNVLCMAYSAWGHTRPMCSLAALIVQEPNHHVIFMCIPFLFDRVLKELASHFPDKSTEEVEELITVIAASENNSEWVDLFRDEYHSAVAEAYTNFSIKCSKTGNVYTIPVPNVLIGDIMDYGIMSIARKTLPESVRCLAFVPCSAYLTLTLFSPEKYGGFGDFEAKTIAEMQRSGKNILDASNKVFDCKNGSVVNIPGLPPYYDYEVCPQASYYPPYAVVFLQCHKYLAECDGAIVMSSNAFEPEAIRTLKAWFAETERPLYDIGPLLPLKHYQNGHNDLIPGVLNDGKKERVFEFLDATLAKHGENSLIYISFGTVYWSTRPEMIYSLIDELIAAGIPFLVAHASSTSKDIPQEVKEKIKASGLGLLITWSPQKNVLAHPVTGWFLSHCGQNGTLEALAYGVPIIAWPFEFDQSLNAMLVSLVHEVGYELLQVRTGEKGIKKLYRSASEDENPKCKESAWRGEMRSVLARACGEDGEKKRANVLKMREHVVASWQEGGETLSDFRAFLKLADNGKF